MIEHRGAEAQSFIYLLRKEDEQEYTERATTSLKKTLCLCTAVFRLNSHYK